MHDVAALQRHTQSVDAVDVRWRGAGERQKIGEQLGLQIQFRNEVGAVDCEYSLYAAGRRAARRQGFRERGNGRAASFATVSASRIGSMLSRVGNGDSVAPFSCAAVCVRKPPFAS